MSSRARSLSELWNDPNQNEVLFVLQVIPDKRDKVIPGAGGYGVIVLPRLQDLAKVQQGKIYVALDTRQISFRDASGEVCCVTLAQEMGLQGLMGDEHSDSPKRKQTKEAIFTFARQHGYPFDITQDKISEQYRRKLREASEINKANPQLLPAVILSPNTAMVGTGVNVPLEQFDPSIYTPERAQLLLPRENAGTFRLHFSNKKRDHIIAQTKTRKDLWYKTEVDLGEYYFQVTKENGIEIKDPKKDEYFPLYYRDSKGEYKICRRFQQMYLERVTAIGMIAFRKKEMEEKSLYSEDEYKKLWGDSHHDRQAAFERILDEYKNRLIPLTEEIEAKHAEQMWRYRERFDRIKKSDITALEKQQQFMRLREELELFVSQERFKSIEGLSSSVYDFLDSRVGILIGNLINPEIESLEKEISSEPSSSLCSVPESTYQTGCVAQVEGYVKCFQEIIGSGSSILKKLQQLRKLREDLSPFISTANDKFPLEGYEELSKELMERIRKEIRVLRQEFREKIIGSLVLYLENIKEKNEKYFIIKLLIYLKSRADIPLTDVTEEENHFMVNCSRQYLNTLKEEDLSTALDEEDKKALENGALLDFLISITIKIPELQEMLLPQIIHSNATALQKLQRLDRFKEHIKPFAGDDDKAETIMALIRVAMDQCREVFLNLESIKLLENFLADLEASDCKNTTRITFLGWSTQVPIPSSEIKMAETKAIKTAALKILLNLKLWVGISHIALSEPELDMISKNAIFLENGALLDSLTADEREALQDSELQRILAGIVYEVPELQSVLWGVLQNEQPKQNSPYTL